jgi:hypothetical protein
MAKNAADPCNCDSRKEDELEKKKIQTEISLAYEEII